MPKTDGLFAALQVLGTLEADRAKPLSRWFLKMAKRRGRQAAGSGESEVRQLLEQQPNAAEDQACWDREHQWSLFHWTAEKVKSEFRAATWQAFWQTAVEGKGNPRRTGPTWCRPKSPMSDS